MSQGWISIHRKIRECYIWDTEEPFSKRDAWIDLLLLANHRDKDTIFDGNKITIKKGQYLTSVRMLAEEWHWGNAKTLKYLRLLEECGMITREANSRRTLITIVNYDIYQGFNNEEQNSSRTPIDTVAERPSTTNNNINNENNDNKYTPSFLEFWKSYPRKNDKAMAYKCYKARLNDGYSEEQLLIACKNYAAECERNKTEQRYIKHGATFLSVNEPFLDYLKGDNGSGTVGTDDGTNEAEYNAFIDRIINGEEQGEMLFV